MSVIRASVVLFTYNQEKFVKDALQSLLDQTYDDLEIVISDDCSKDNTWDIISNLAQEYSGPKKIILNRNCQNLGVAANYSKAVSLSSGDVIFSAAGDDISLPTRCSDSVSVWLQSGKIVDLVAADAFDMTIDGQVVGIKSIDNLQDFSIIEWFSNRPYHFGATHMVTRRMLDVNELDRRLNAEDQCLMFRALLMGGAIRIDRPLVKHRQNGISYKTKPLTYDAKKKKLIYGAESSLIESEQMLLDAKFLGRDFDVAFHLKKNVADQEFIIRMLSFSKFGSMVRYFICTKNVILTKKIRFFLYAAFPYIYIPSMRLKILFKK